MEFVEYFPLLHLQLYVERKLLPHQHPTQLYFINGERNPSHHHQFSQSQVYHHSHFIDSSVMVDNYSDNYLNHGATENSTAYPLVTGGADSQVKVDSTAEAIDQLPLRLPTWGIVTLVILYSFTFFLGVIGNCCVVFIVSRLRRMKTVTNYFIVSLAIADLLVLIFCLLPNLISNIFVPWVLGWLLCKTVPYIQGVSVCASIYFLVAISLERCIAIGWPFKYYITKEKAKLAICAIWLWSCIVALPWALFFRSGAFDEENPQLEFCVEIWPEAYQDWQTYYFLIGNLFICYVFPLGMILVCYLTIWFRVYRRPVPSDCYHKAIELIHQRSKAAVIKMFIVVVLFFALSWLPLYVIIIRVKFFSESMSELEASFVSFVYPIAQWLLCFNSSINPYIYFYNIKFRKAFTGIFYGFDRKSRVQFKHKSPTVNILLKRFNTYRVETTMSNNNDHDYNSDSM